jgi:hypothetical protein
MAVPDPILGFQGLGKKARITRTRFINLKEIAKVVSSERVVLPNG